MARTLAAFLLLSACARAGAGAGASLPAEAPPVSSTNAGAPAPGAAPAAVTSEAPASAAAASPVTPAGPPPAPPAGTPLLPRVSVKTMGLHVGGGPNDADGKAPFLQALEPRFPDFLRCYQLVAEPGRSGSFGVDLQIETAGGRPKVGEPRSALEGEAFKECVLGVFQSVEFPPLKKPFVISYSLRFSVEP